MLIVFKLGKNWTVMILEEEGRKKRRRYLFPLIFYLHIYIFYYLVSKITIQFPTLIRNITFLISIKFLVSKTKSLTNVNI